MAQGTELVTVYRSMDETAKESCETLVDLFTDEGLAAVMLDDSAPGVPEGVFEVQVPADQAARADEIMRANPLPDEVEAVDASPELDTEAVWYAEGSTTAEMESQAIKNLLDVNGIAALIVGNTVLPNFPFEVRVAREYADRARLLIADAQASGPAAAEEAEKQTERESPKQ
jgi:hypothetical protein